MIALQKIEFDMLKEFVRICDELNLTYYLVCGSALGAVKYGGFIPWDDDMDVALPRKDYEIFCEKAQAYLPDYLFLQNYKTDPMFPMFFSKIRDSRTTYIEKSMANIPMHHGIYIDVFPIDGYPADPKEQKVVEKEKYRYALSSLCCLNLNHSWKVKPIIILEKMLGYHKRPSKFIKRVEKYIAAYPVETSELWCNHGNWQGKREYAPAWHYGDGTWVTFEGLKVRIPEKYDEYLTQKYGDWRSDLPEDEKVGHHYYEICDTECTFKNYISKSSTYKIRLKK